MNLQHHFAGFAYNTVCFAGIQWSYPLEIIQNISSLYNNVYFDLECMVEASTQALISCLMSFNSCGMDEKYANDFFIRYTSFVDTKVL